MQTNKHLVALAIAAGLHGALGGAMVPKRQEPVPNIGLRLLDGSPAPMPQFGMMRRGRGKGKGRQPRHSSVRFVAQDKRDARKARNRRHG